MDWTSIHPAFANQYVLALAIVIAAIIVSKLLQWLGIVWIRRVTEKTETDLDDRLIAITTRPFFYLLLLAGVYYAARVMTVLDPYMRIVNGAAFVLLILILSWTVARIIALFTTRWFQKKRGLKESPRLLNIIVAVVIYIAAGIVVLSYFDIEISPFVAALGLGGLAVGLALQDTLSNVFSGLHIIGDQPIRVGDVVDLKGEDLVGVVEDIGWRSTRIRSFTNNLVIVPNNKIANSILTNFEMPEQPMRKVIECGVDYGSDLKKVEKVAYKVAKKIQKMEEADPGWDPLIRFHTFADSNVNFRVILQATNRGNTFMLEHEFVKALHEEFAKEGIEISWPVRKIYHESALELKKKAARKKK